MREVKRTNQLVEKEVKRSPAEGVESRGQRFRQGTALSGGYSGFAPWSLLRRTTSLAVANASLRQCSNANGQWASSIFKKCHI